MRNVRIRTNGIARRKLFSSLLASTALTASVLSAGLLASIGPAFAQQVIDGGATETVIGTGGGTQASPWNIGDDLIVGETGVGTLEISAGGVVSNVVGRIGDEVGSVGAVIITDLGSTWTNSGRLFIGAAGSGTLEISGGAEVTSVGGTIAGSPGSTGAVVVTGLNSTWTISDGLFVGNSGTGTLDILNGGYVLSDVARLGIHPGSTGTITVSGANSEWENQGAAYIGGDDTGALVIADGGKVFNQSGASYVANELDGTGTVSVTGAGSAWNTADLHIGYRGDGDLEISDGGAVVTVGTARLGSLEEDASGVVTVTGADSLWTTSDQIVVGDAGHGTLDITAGGDVSNASALVGRYGTGAVTVTGTGSTWTVGSELDLGGFSTGVGSLEISAGGIVNSAESSIGAIAGSIGDVTVTGAGSAWNISGDYLFIGQGGEGDLTIADGGVVIDARAVIGSGASAIGAVVVTGADSTWTNALSLVIGDSGSGELTIEDGGTVTAGDATIGGLGGTGAATVTGADSSWTVADYLSVGVHGTGTLAIAAGGLVESAEGYIGDAVGSSGEVTVAGAGSVWNNLGDMSVGYGGDGGLYVSSGGSVVSGTATIGSDPDGSGQVSITGTGSSWAITGGLVVGDNGTGALNVTDAGVVLATSVTIAAQAGSTGWLNIGSDQSDPAAAAGTLSTASIAFGDGDGTLVFNHTDGAYSFAPDIAGSGSILHRAGTTTYTGNGAAFAGGTSVDGGTFYVNGGLGGTMDVALGAALGGTGTIGTTAIAAGGHLIGIQGQTLTLASLDLDAGSIVDATLGAPGTTALFDVTGDLTLDGTLNVTDAGGFGPGLYRLFDYGGTLDDQGMDIGSVPGSVSAADLTVQTAVLGQVNLVNAPSVSDLLFWDGDTLGNADNGVIDGGNGTWTVSSTNWTNFDGSTNGAMTPVPGFAVFAGASGTVVADDTSGALSVSGMQFATDGYVLTGDMVELVGSGGDAIIRVGDGTGTGAGYSATIAADLVSSSGVAKTDLGTLILTGTNDFGGDMTVAAGTLDISAGGTVDNEYSYIARDNGSTATVTVNGAGSAWTSDRLHVGYGGAGTLVIAGGGTVSDENGYVGYDAGSTGTVTVTGAGSAWANIFGLTVGDSGAGSLAISAGGLVTSSGGSLAESSGSTGAVTVAGAGSAWTNAGNLTVGGYGNGTLTISAGGSVSSNGGVIAYEDTSTSAVTVSGAGSNWTNSAGLLVGGSGHGTLVISAGGVVSNTIGYIGADTPATGAITVTGAGSAWVNTGELVIGAAGSGTLTIANGGAVSAASIDLTDSSGATGTINIGAASGNAAAAAGILTTPSIAFGNGNGTLVFNHTDSAYSFSADTTGTGSILHEAGTTTYTGNGAAFAGTTELIGGTLHVDGALGGTIEIYAGAALGGAGSVGDTTNAAGGHLIGTQGQTLTLASLDLDAGSLVDVSLGAPGTVALFDVTGELTLDGTLNVTDAGGFGPGLYRLFDYGGALDDQGLDIGVVPVGTDLADLAIQTAIAGQVNLVNSANTGDFLFWDGDALGNADNGIIDGGDGVWTLASTNWTNTDGSVNDAMTPVPGFVIFAGDAGTVTVDDGAGLVSVTGMQFAAGGYVIAGDAVELAGTGGDAIIRVGDGTLAGAAYTAMIGSDLTGSAQLVKNDRGTLILTGTNSYSGGTRINGGVLEVSEDANLGLASGAITFNGGTLATTASFDSTRGVSLLADGILDVGAATTLGLAGDITGTGDLVKQGEGTLVLTGANAYGDTTIEAGTLVGNSGSISGDIANAGTVIFSQTTDGTFAGDIAGLGGTDGVMAKDGAGALTLTGTSTLDWTIGGGSVVTAAERFGGDAVLSTGGGLVFDQAADASSAILLSGDGSGIFTKARNGLLTLTGANGGFTGHTDIDGGTLLVADALGGTISINAGGILAGNGTVGTTVVRTGGTISPGADGRIDTLNVAGDLTFEAGSTYVVHIEAPDQADLVAVAGTATIDGGAVQVATLSAEVSYLDLQTYRLLTATSLADNTEFTLNQPFLFLDVALAYGSDYVDLTLSRSASFTNAALTFNQTQAANALDGLEQSGDALAAFNALLGMTDAEEARRAFDLTSGEIHASGQHVINQTFMLFNRSLRQQGATSIGLGNAGAQVFTAPLGYGPVAANAGVVAINDAASHADARTGGVWIAPLAARGTIDGNGNAGALDWWTAGLAGGYEGVVDVGSGNALAGLAFGYLRSGGTVDARLSSMDADGFHLGAYGAWTDGARSLAGSAAYAASHVSTQRQIAFGGINRTAEARYANHTIGLSTELAYAIDMSSGFTVSPLFTLDAGWSENGGYAETGAGALGLTSTGQSYGWLDTGLGIALAHTIETEGGTLTLEGRAVWEHAFAGTIPGANHLLAGSPVGLSVYGPDAGSDRLRLGAGVAFEIGDDLTVRANYDGLFAGSQNSHAGSIGLNVKF